MVENRANFIPHLYLSPPQGVTPSEFREDLDIHKTRMNGLSCGEESMTIYSAVLIGCQRVTDGRTDRRTDGRQAYSYYVLQLYVKGILLFVRQMAAPHCRIRGLKRFRIRIGKRAD